LIQDPATLLQIEAAPAPATPNSVINLTNDQLGPIVAEAKQLWINALGAGDPRLSALNSVSIAVGDLGPALLGETTGDSILIDRNAAGWGWFVDPTPQDNSEFSIVLSSGVYAAAPRSPASGRMDLLTTVVHELGNAMGFAEDQGQDVSGATLQAGVRRIPTVAAALPLSAGDPSVTVPAVSNLPAANPSNGFVTVQPAFTGDSLIKVSLQSVIPVAVAPAALTPNGAPASVVVVGAPVLPGIAPSFGITVGGTVSAPLVSGPIQSIDPVPSFMSLEPGARAVAEVVSAEPPVVERHSSQPADQGGTKPTINWDNTFEGVANSSSVPAVGSSEWLDDFLNHLGQSEAQRNPNAGIRLRPSPSVVASVHG
jgi:hypothetical protein